MRLNNKVTKRIPPKEKKALKAEYDKKKEKLPNSYKELKKNVDNDFMSNYHNYEQSCDFGKRTFRTNL